MAALAELYSLARDQHQAGNYTQAEYLYRQILAADPKHVEAQHCLGILSYQQGHTELAISLISQARDLKPSLPAPHYALGIIFADQGKLEEAVESYRAALRLDPNYAEAKNNLGSVLLLQGKAEPAALQWQEVLHLQPNSAEVHCNLAGALERLGRIEEAIAHCQTALALRPDLAEAHNNLANALAAQGHVDQATARFQQALLINPRLVPALNNFGNFLVRQDKLDEALACFQQAVREQPGSIENRNNIGNVLFLKGHFTLAEAAYSEALRLNADNADAHFNRALLWLLQGNWEKGWPEYEWRWQTKGFSQIDLGKPRWDGSPVSTDGGTILLCSEQGLGDTIQFIRNVPLIKERGWRVIVLCQTPLLRLLTGQPFQPERTCQTEMPDVRVVTRDEPLPPFDTHLPLMSLPGLFGNSPDSVPAPIPYLRADPGLVEHWRRELQSLHGFRIGIAWQGSALHRGDRQRSIPLSYFRRLTQVEGVHLVSLQKGAGAEQLEKEGAPADILNLGNRLDEAAGPFMDTAAIMKNLDLVISSDTAVPHLAGALGVPVWLALGSVPDWRWLLERDNTPWYPTMRLFRQLRVGAWDDVFARMAEELQRTVLEASHT